MKPVASTIGEQRPRPRASLRSRTLVDSHVAAILTEERAILDAGIAHIDVDAFRSSPGTLPNHMTVERVRAGANPRSRNESLAHFMAGMGLMERRGRGWLIMRREMLAFNGTEPELLHDEPNRFVRVTFRLAAAGGAP